MEASELREIELEQPVWHRFYTVSPLIVVGTREGEGFDLAPKHMATPLGWDNHFGFVCTPRHATYRNAVEHGSFTVTVPRPEQVVVTSLTATPRCDDEEHTPGLEAMEVFPAEEVEGVFLEKGYAFLECELERTVDGFGDASLVAGEIVGARVHADALRATEASDQELLRSNPLLAFLSPDRYARVGEESYAFPYPADFEA